MIWNYCAQCGHKLEASWRYCPNCSQLIGGGSPGSLTGYYPPAPLWTYYYPYTYSPIPPYNPVAWTITGQSTQGRIDTAGAASGDTIS